MKVSPNQINRFRRCPRKIGFEYVEGFRPPSSPKQEFGLEVHRQLERWLRDGVLPDDTPEGRTAKQGIVGRWLPPPGPELLVEHKWEIDLGGDVMLGGIADCVQKPISRSGVPLVIDHKSTSSLQWALTPEQLEQDVQAILYSLWAAFEWNAPAVDARWIYYSASNPKGGGARKPTGAKPVSVRFELRLDKIIDRVGAILSDVEEIVRIRRAGIPGKELPPDPAACEMFQGCYHKGRCDDLGAEDRVYAKFAKKYT
jgi:hypothetical protein